MLQLVIPEMEHYDEIAQEFILTKQTTLQLEHSLVSISKWESKWQVPFLAKGNKTTEQSIDYIRCMTLTQNVDPRVYYSINARGMKEIAEYIEAPMTATTFAKDEKSKINRDIITSEIIYYWMIALNIPFECQKWHLNRLLTLINVCNIKNQPARKFSQKELIARNMALNQARKSKLQTSG